MRINGNLVFNTDASGEIQNAYVERLASAPSFNAAHKGRLYFNTTTSLYYYNDGAAWVPFATGGNAAALQTEVDNVESTIGPIVNANGTFNASALTGVPLISGATDITDALTLLAQAADSTDTLAELHDVNLGVLSNGQYLKYNSGTGKWYNDTLQLNDVTDVTATAAEVNKLSGATFSTTEINYVTGVTSPIQTQLNNKQPLDAGLTALAVFNTNGIIVQTADNTFAGRTMQYPAQGLTITNPDGVAGDPSFALANDLAAVEGLTGTGYAIRTGTDTWTTRTITGQAGRIVVTNGDGVSSNTDVDLATVTDGGTGTFLKFTRDTYGRVSGTTAVAASDITALVSGIYVDVAGDTMTGNLTMSGGATVTGLPDPVAGTDAANKNYVDAAVTGLSWKQAVHVMSVTNVSISSAPASIDSHTLNNGERILLTGQSTATENGIYVFNGAGNALTRSTDADTYAELSGAAVFVEQGTVYAGTGWTQSTNLTSFSGQSWAQFTGSGTYVAGAGLSLTGNTFDVNLGAGIAQLPSDEVGIDLYSSIDALRLTTDGVTASSATGAKLTLVLKSAGGLTQDTNGLYIPAAGVTNAMLLNSSVGLNADSGTGSLALGQTLLVEGNSVQGVVTSVSGQTITVTASNASTTQKGTASFAAADFDVTAGAVSIKAGGVDNAQLAFDHIIVTGTTGSDQVALGESFAIVGGAGGEVSTNSAANQVSISVRDATYSLKGVASFSNTDFTVSSGAVSIIAKNLDSLTDVAVSSAVAGDTLINDGTNFVNRQVYFLYSSGSSSTSHVVSHNLGQKYCNVTVVDASDEVIIPQSITFDSSTQLTVTFTSAINCKVVVMGVNSAA